MKIKHSVILLVLGFCVDFIGSFAKIMHRASADMLLLIGLILKLAGIFFLVYKLLKHPKLKDFMNF